MTPPSCVPSRRRAGMTLDYLSSFSLHIFNPATCPELRYCETSDFILMEKVINAVFSCGGGRSCLYNIMPVYMFRPVPYVQEIPVKTKLCMGKLEIFVPFIHSHRFSMHIY